MRKAPSPTKFVTEKYLDEILDEKLEEKLEKKFEEKLRPYATKKDLEEKLRPYATKKDLEEKLRPYATKKDLEENTKEIIQIMHELFERQNAILDQILSTLDDQKHISRKHEIKINDHDVRIEKLEKAVN